MGKKFRLTALILAVSILLNMVPLPASAQEDAAVTQSDTEENNQNVQPLADVDDDLDSNLNGGTGGEQNGGTGGEQNGGTGGEQNGGTDGEQNGGTGGEQNGGTGDEQNGGTGDEQNGGTGDELITGDDDELITGDDDELIIDDDEHNDVTDDELIIGDDSSADDSGSNLTGVTDEELMIMPLEGETNQPAWESQADWEAKCGDSYNEETGLVIDSGWDLICLSNIDPKLYFNKKLVLTQPDLDTTTCPDGADSSLKFEGLGRDAVPFVGTVEYGKANEATITLNRPLFNRLSFGTDTSICTLYLKSSQNTTALLANTVDGCTAEGKDIKVYLEEPIVDNVSNISKVLPPVFQTVNVPEDVESTNIRISVTNRGTVGVTGNGLICNTLGAGAQLTVTGITTHPGLTAASGAAGGLVGTMESGSILQVGGSTDSGSTEGGETQSSPAAGSTAIEISRVSGGDTGGLVGSMASTASVIVNAAVTVSGISGSNAGGLVGQMNSGATLNAGSGSLILKDTDTAKAVTGSTNAGGCVGSATDIVFSIPTITVDTSATVNGTGDAGVGGLIGAYTYNGTADRFSSVSQISIPGLNLTCGNNNGSAGALFGRLSNNSATGAVKTFSISNVTVDGVAFQNGSVGGLIGQYGTTGLSAALEISGATVSTSLTNNARDYGGLIGVDDCGSPAYIKISGTTAVTTNHTSNPTDYGGLVSRMQGDNAGHLLNLEGDITITANGGFSSSTSAGGLAAYLQNGVIRVAGNVTITGTPNSRGDTRGWVVGDLRNALVYVDKDPKVNGNLTLPDKEGTKYNDLGRWGQVLWANGENLPQLLTFDSTNHTVTVAAATTGSCATHTDATCYSVSSLLEFAAVALRLQLNEMNSLKFTDGDSSSSVDITIGQDITLSNGLFGFQRDYDGSDSFDVTIHGGSHTITLPNTSVYPTGSSHNRLGLLSNVKTLNAENLTVAGRITFDQSSGPIYAGGLAAYANGDVTLTNVTGSASISGSGTMGSDELSGLIAHVEANKTLAFIGCSWTSTITDNSTSTDVYIGGFLGKGTNATMNVSGSTLGSSTLSATIQRNSATTAKVGGLVASLSGGSLDINGLTINNAHIEATKATGTCGGLLSYELLDTTTDIVGVTITGSSVNAGSASFGGLVYKASGVMTIEKNAEGIGASIGARNTFAGGSSDSAPSGLLVCRGDKANDNDKALYLKVLDRAYSVDSDTTVTLSSGTYFDELVGITEGRSGNGVVSYATSNHDPIDRSGCNTYQQQITNDGTIWDNPRTRYYYNLDSFALADSVVDSPEKMVMWSVSQYCADNLKSNFADFGNATNGFTITGNNLSLAGYSYYPVSPRDGVSIADATITFAFDELETAEEKAGESGDVVNKKPSNKDRQHYLMHTGIFEDVSMPLSVNNLILSGTVGPAASGSGALISGSIASNRDVKSITLTINALTLNNLTISGGDTSSYAPLLINRIGSYVTMNMDDVSTLGYSVQTTAATSLIGHVGDVTSGTDIRLTFSNMALDAKIGNEDHSDYYGSIGTIFSHATFLESFAYSDKTTCFGEYNFAVADSAPKYTVGVEVSNATSGRNQTLQYKDESGNDYVKYPGGTAPAGDEQAAEWFKVANYRRYVNQTEDDSRHYYELDINQRPIDLTTGCGTYGDPYVITAPSQLAAVAKIIRGENVYDWSVRMNDQVLAGGFGNQDGHGQDPSNAGDTNYKLARGIDEWNGLLENDKVRDYLRNAYYQISDDLHLSSTWGGLGSADKPFMGVIVGGKENSTDPNPTIKITSTQAKQYGGLVKFSQGSVIKDLKIEFSGNAIVLDAGVPSDLSDAAFFGGVVGWCHGGDTIIENVSVTGLNVPSISGSNTYLAAVGGYVGLAGGYDANTGGGVVFKNVTADMALSKDGHFYVNNYVGRVLDGYAIADVDLNNTDKNYQIKAIGTGTHLSKNADSGALIVNDAAGLWLLSAIVNSGSTGKARSCDYSKVGTALDDGNNSPLLYDEKGSSKPYLVKNYTTDDVRSILAGTQPVAIELGGECDMTEYGNGFRGIGTSYGGNRLLNVGSLDGKNQKVILNQNRQEYTAESGKWVSRGAGLFTQLNLSGSLSVSDLTLCGQTGITCYSSGSEDTSTDVKAQGDVYPAAGMLVGRSTGGGTVSLTDVCLVPTTVEDQPLNPQVVGTAHSAGGLIGWLTGSSQVTLTNCTYKDLTVQGRLNTGGLLGYLQVSKATITCATDKPLENGTITSRAGLPTDNSGAGGLVGKCYQTVLTIGSETSRLMLKGLNVNYPAADNAAGDRPNCGGLVGLWGAKKDTTGFDAIIQNVSLEGQVTITGGKMANAGGLVGGLTYQIWGNWNDGGNIKPKITGVNIAQETNSSMCVTRARQMGGLIGVMVANGAMEVSHVRMGTSANQVVVANNGEGGTLTVGGLFGVTLFPNMAMEDVRIENTKVLLHTAGGMRGAALLFAFLQKNTGTIDLRHIVMKDCVVLADKDGANMGLLYAKMENDHTITGSNILVQDCSVGLALDVNASDPTKFKLHSLSGDVGTLLDYGKVGLKFKDKGYQSYEAMDATAFKAWPAADNCAKTCVWGGDGAATVKLVGVTLKQTKNALPHTKNFGTDLKSGSYIIRANYLGKDILTTDDVTGSVTVHATDKPVTNCDSLPTLADSTKLTGDGVYSDTNGSVASQILADYSGKNWKRIGLDASVKEDFGKIQAGENYFSLTTFASTRSKTSSAEIADFPVLKITAKDAKTINEVVDAYISMLTNTHFSHASDGNGKVQKIENCPYTIEATTYRWGDGGFAATDGTLRVVDGNVLQSNGGRYDCDQDQFTLLDVKFADPKNTKAIAYHLYIPVAIEKKLEYRFWAAAQVGTSYNAGAYSNLRDVVIGSHHEPVTVMIGFEYLRTKAEWQSAVDSGENLLWSMDKVVTLSDAMVGYNKIPLPDGTELILVDRGVTADAGQKDKAYTATVNASAWNWTGRECGLDFTKFTAMDGTGTFQARDFCDALKLTAKADNQNGTFVKTDRRDNATLRAQLDGVPQYFRLAATGEAGTKYSVTVGISEPLSEQYYLTIRTPEASSENAINYFTVWYENPTNAGRMPTEPMPWGVTRYYAKNDSENKIILSNFFKQEFTITAEPSDGDPVEAKTGDDVKSRSNIVATLKTVLRFESKQHADTFEQYINGRKLYQCFDLSLMEYVNDVQGNKPIVKGTQIAVDYGDGSGSPISLTQSQESVRLIGNADGYSVSMDENGTLTMEAKVYLAYDAAGIVDQFPTRPRGSGTRDGIQIRGSSSLAYSAEALTNSFIRENDSDKNDHRYYRGSDSAATMSYSARENVASAPGDSVSQLGINGLEDNFPIQSLGVYNVERVENASSAKFLKCTVSLYCKNDENQYDLVTGSIGSYLPELKLGLDITDASGNIVNTPMTAPSEDDSVIFALPETFDPGSFIEIPVEMKVLTGEAFEKLGYRYANYQVRLTACLLENENGSEIDNSEASDYIVYTNAKILRELIFQQTGG